jgi:hypothetical protein
VAEDLVCDITGVSVQCVYNGTTWDIFAQVGGAGGSVVSGPASSTDNAVARFDSTTGKIIQNSVVTVADTTGNVAGVGTLSLATTLGVGGATPSASGSGITFPASMSDSTDPNTFDDYEEGTWTPTVGGTATYSVQAGTYTKIGRLINIRFQLIISSLGTGSTTFMTGLPYNATTGGQGVVSYATGVASNFYSIVSHIDNSTQIAFNTTSSLGSGINYQATVFATSTYVLGNALYI